MAPGPHSPADRPATAIEAAARLLADGEVEAAARGLEAIVTATPAYPAAHVLLAKAYEAAARWEEALSAWHQAYFLVPTSPLVRRERQRLLDAQVRAALPTGWAPTVAPEADSPGAADDPVAETEIVEPDPTPEVDAAAPSEPILEADDPAQVEPSGDEAIAIAPGGDLPDAHHALAEDTSETLGHEAYPDDLAETTSAPAESDLPVYEETAPDGIVDPEPARPSGHGLPVPDDEAADGPGASAEVLPEASVPDGTAGHEEPAGEQPDPGAEPVVEPPAEAVAPSADLHAEDVASRPGPDSTAPPADEAHAETPAVAAPPYEAPDYSAPIEAEPLEEIHDDTPEAAPDPIEPEPEEIETFGHDEDADDLWVSPGPSVSSALDEPTIAPPDMEASPGEPIAGEADGDAAWWQRASEAEAPPSASEPSDGWAIVEETATDPLLQGPTEAAIAPPGEAPPPEPVLDESDGVEEAQIVNVPPATDDVEPAPDPPGANMADELDSLIQQLEDAPRIRPDPTFDAPDVVFDERVADDMVSETLARIYAAQHQYAEAAIVYEKLAQQKPERAEEMLRRAAELRAQDGDA